MSFNFPTGFQVLCMNCQRIKVEENKEYGHVLSTTYDAIYNRKLKQKIKHEIMTYYSNGQPVCQKCGETDIRCLSIDHLNGGGTKHRKTLGRSSDSLYRWLRKNNYPKEYQVLCMNCQFIKEREK